MRERAGPCFSTWTVDVHLVLGKVSAGELTSAAALLVQSIHIDSGTLVGAALLHGCVKSQLALAALCGQLPQYLSIGMTSNVSFRKVVQVISKHEYQNLQDNRLNTIAAGGRVSDLTMQHKYAKLTIVFAPMLHSNDVLTNVSKDNVPLGSCNSFTITCPRLQSTVLQLTCWHVHIGMITHRMVMGQKEKLQWPN